MTLCCSSESSTAEQVKNGDIFKQTEDRVDRLFRKGGGKPTRGVDEGRIELLGQQGVGHVPEELLQQRGHIVNAVLLIQLDVHATVELLAQLREG